MTRSAPTVVGAGHAALLHGAATAMDQLHTLATEIETEVLAMLGSGDKKNVQEVGMQKLDLLLQSLREMQHLFERAPQKLHSSKGFDELILGIKLEQLRAHFVRSTLQDVAVTGRANHHDITVFE